jgi:hypothetical protein
VACLKSWRDFGHELHVYTYDPDVPLPAGVVRRDASEVLSSSRVYTYRRGGGAGSVAAFTNEFRHRLILEKGVTWVDTDVLCLSSTWPDEPYRLAWESSSHVRCGNAVFGAPAGDRLPATALEIVLSIELDGAEYGDLGPAALTRAVTALSLTDLPADHSRYYPISHRECPMLLDAGRRAELDERLSGSLAVHLWNEVWTRSRVPTFLRPPRGSFMDEVYARHDVKVPIEAYIEDPAVLEFTGDDRTVPFDEYERLREWALEMQAELQRRDR